jgi:hypothetical protein
LLKDGTHEQIIPTHARFDPSPDDGPGISSADLISFAFLAPVKTSGNAITANPPTPRNPFAKPLVNGTSSQGIGQRRSLHCVA